METQQVTRVAELVDQMQQSNEEKMAEMLKKEWEHLGKEPLLCAVTGDDREKAAEMLNNMCVVACRHHNLEDTGDLPRHNSKYIRMAMSCLPLMSTENVGGKEKSFQSAIVVIPSAVAFNEFQKVRKEHDPNFERWMSHMTLAFPFLPDTEQNFAQAAEAIRKEVQGLTPFEISCDRDNVGAFSHGKLWTGIVKPEGDAKEKLRQIQEIMQALFPQFDEQANKSNEGFTPHLTLGKFDKSK